MELPEAYTVVDFETKDPYISRGYGSGYVFALNHDKKDFFLLGMGIYDSATKSSVYLTDTDEMKEAILKTKHIVCHNAQYDVGCILVLFKGDDRFNLEDYTIYDTLVMAKALRQDMITYSLESCCVEFNLADKKQSNKLADYVWDSGLYQQMKEEETGRKVHVRPSDNLLLKLVMSHLDLLPNELVGEYCIADVLATKGLFEYLIDQEIGLESQLVSDLLKVCIAIRLKGVRIDLEQARKVADELAAIESKTLADINNEFNLDINLNSGKQLAEFLEILGITNYPRTQLGNPSISTEFLEELDNPWAQALAEARVANKIKGSFVEKMIKYQGFDNNINGTVGIMYTSLHIFGAVRTGRFTSGGGAKSFELNIQQIPSAGTKLGKICRSMFLPDEGEKWISSDYSNQEPRIQVHYAVQLNCTGANKVADAWRENPTDSFHQKVATFTGLPYKEAKTINLGLSYGMGEGKLCENLGLPTVPKVIFNGAIIKVAGPAGRKVLETYHTSLPFMKEVTTTVNHHFKRHKKIKTLGGRILRINPYFAGDWKKGFSKLIQGSAADQTIRALIACHKAGLKILNTVHDEINITSANPEKDAEVLKKVMEEALPIDIPMVAEVAIGDNWAEAK